MTAAIDITTEQRKTLLALLRRFIPGVAVWAYGSRVKWAARPNSDLDLVVFTSPAQRHLVSELKDAIGESNLPFLVDLHVWDEVPERFYEIIRKEYVVLQEAQQLEKRLGMAGKWQTIRLGDVVVINPDAIGRDWPYPHIRYIDISSVKEGQIEVSPQWMKISDAPSRAKRLIHKGDTVLSTVRPNRRSMFFASQPDDDWVVSTGFAVLRPDTSRIVPRYLYACVFNRDFTEYLITREKGAAYPAVSPDDIANAEIMLPPLIEQQAIAHIIGALDDKIELNRKMNETLETIARAIFKSWFVDFDPVRAKVSGQAPPGLKPELAALFPDAFENSELGEIPRRWASGCLGDVASFLSGYAFKSKDWIERGVPVVKIGSVKPGIVDLNQVSFVSDTVAEEAKRFRLSPGDLLIGMTGYVGEVGLVPYTNTPPLLNQRVGKFVLERLGTSNLAFIYCLTRRQEFKSEVETKSHGTAQANVSAESILSIPIVVPPKTLRDEFNRIGQPVFDRILANHAESRTLAAIRDALLPKLISGELRVPDAERIVGRTL